MCNFKFNSLVYQKTGKGKKCCQDYVDSKTFENGISVVALADGLGSKNKSGIGAKIAVETTIEELGLLLAKRNIEDFNPCNIASIILTAIKTNIAKVAREDNIEEYSSTLLFYAIKENSMIIGQIGDGYIAAKKKDSDFKLVFSPKDDSDAVNSTKTIFSSPYYMNLAKCKASDIDCIFISSDGTDKLKRNNFVEGHNYTPFISSKKYGRKPQAPIFKTLSFILQDTKQGSLNLKRYSIDILKALNEMLLLNDPDDDVTFAFTNLSVLGKSYDVSEIMRKIMKKVK